MKNLNPVKTSLLSIIAVAGIALSGHAQTVQTGSGKDVKEIKQVVVPATCVFRDMEIQIDGFAMGVFGSKNSHFATGPGGGFGVNFFFLRYFGIGYEGEWYSNRGNAQHMPVGGNLFFRYPICAWHLAPYVMVGGGGTWDGYGTGYGNVGGGLEYRFTDHIGVFADGRYLYGGTGNVAEVRSGVRIAF